MKLGQKKLKLKIDENEEKWKIFLRLRNHPVRVQGIFGAFRRFRIILGVMHTRCFCIESETLILTLNHKQ